MKYIRSLDKHEDSRCFLCLAASAQSIAQRKDHLVIWSTPLSMVIINAFPYSNGHLLVSPRAHKPGLDDLTNDELLDMQVQTAAATILLKRAVSAQGFNIGINLGLCAGAGVPGHLHQHIVPRWAGDTNFMSIVGETRIVPQAMSQLYDELLTIAVEMKLDNRSV